MEGQPQQDRCASPCFRGTSALDHRFDYLGAGWSPLHVRLRHLDWQPLLAVGADASLRTDGLAVLVTGPSAGGPATLTVRSAEAVKPHVVVARFAGDLPRD